MYVCRAAAAVEVGPADDVLVELKRILLRSASPATAVRAAHASARVYELRRDFEKALFYNRIACRHAEALGDEVILAHCDNQSGMLLAVDSRFEEAAAVYRRALERTEAREGVSSVFRAVWRDNLGYCLIALDRVPEGLALVHEALEALEREGARSYTVYPLLDLCFGYLKCDRYAEARWFGEEGLERVPRAGSPPSRRASSTSSARRATSPATTPPRAATSTASRTSIPNSRTSARTSKSSTSAT